MPVSTALRSIGQNGVWEYTTEFKPAPEMYSYTFNVDGLNLIDNNNIWVNRAICGLSMGGFHTLYISLNYPDMFNYSGMFSAAIGVSEQQMCLMYDNFDAKLAKYFSKKPALLWMGGHIWRNWRIYLTC